MVRVGARGKLALIASSVSAAGEIEKQQDPCQL